MPEKQINELETISEDITGANILHTQETGNVDVTMTVQELSDYLGVGDNTDPGSLSGALDTGNDGIVVTDASDSHVQKRITYAALLALVTTGLATVGGSVSSGSFNIGAIQFRADTGISNSNSAQGFLYPTPFTTNTKVVMVTTNKADSTKILPVTGWTADGFTINRNFLSSADEAFSYFAIGY